MSNEQLTSLSIANRESQSYERKEIKLDVIEVRGERVLTTKQLSSVYETEEVNIRNNFKNNKDKFIEGKHYFELSGDSLREFKHEVKDIYSVPNNVNKLMLWTERGASRMCKILDTDRAWERFDELEETYFKVRNNQFPINISKELKAIFMLDGKQQELDGRVTKIENRMTIETGHQKVLHDLVNKKVVAILGGKDKPAYKELGKKAFLKCWKDYKEHFEVASYKDTPLKDFEAGKHFITEWKPDRELELMIKGCNAS